MNDRVEAAITEAIAALQQAEFEEMLITRNARFYIRALDAGNEKEADRWLRSIRGWLEMDGDDDDR